MSGHNCKDYRPSISVLWCVGACLALVGGFYFRINGLGISPFAIDEYYIAASVRNILERGLPEYECGGYYTRGLLYQYVLTPFFAYGSNDELYARLVTVAANILTVPALYLLARNIAGKTVAYAVIILFSLSVWEIEFARFARMYAPFQMLFIWYIYFLYKWTFRQQESARLWCYATSLLSVFVYEGGIFLVLLNYFPFFMARARVGKVGIFISTALLVTAYLYLSIDFRTFTGAVDGVPVTSQLPGATSSSRILLPPLLLKTLGAGEIWLFLFFVPLSMVVLSGIRLSKQLLTSESYKYPVYRVITVLLLAVLSVINAHTLLAIAVLLSLALNWISFRDLSDRIYYPFIGSIILMFGFWSLYVLQSSDWFYTINTEGVYSARQALKVLFGYPDVFNKIFLTFFHALPVFTIMISFVLLAGIIEAILKGHRQRKEYLFVATIIIGLITCVCVLRQPYLSTRYVFFLYPLILLLVVVTMRNLIGSLAMPERQSNAAFIVAIAAFMALSEDYSLGHYLNIDSEEVLYRKIYDEDMSSHLYPRWDFRSPAVIVNKNREPDDLVITSTYAIPYYLERLDYFYHYSGANEFQERVGCNGRRNLLTNAGLIHEPDDLLDLIGKAGTTVWLVIRSEQYEYRKPPEAMLGQLYADNKVYRSVDGNLEVYKIPPISLR